MDIKKDYLNIKNNSCLCQHIDCGAIENKNLENVLEIYKIRLC